MPDDRNILSKTLAGLRWLAMEHTAMVIAFAFAVGGAFLMLIGFLVTPASTFDNLLAALTKAGMNPQTASTELDHLRGSAWTTLLWSVGGTFISIGFVSIAWEVFVKKSWVTLLRQEVLDALTDVE